jgi:hypothetical protein
LHDLHQRHILPNWLDNQPKLNTTKVNSEFISILFLPFGGGMLQSKNNQRIKYNTLNILCHYAAEDDFCNDQWQCKR